MCLGMGLYAVALLDENLFLKIAQKMKLWLTRYILKK